MKITIACVGRLKERFYTDAAAEYLKRLQPYADISVSEIADEKAPEKLSDAEIAQIKEKEGDRLLKAIPTGAYAVALAINGAKVTSEQLSVRIDSLMTNGQSHIVFIIGGSLGLSPRVLARADYKLSFSDMTFPHQLMRVILLEQIYRAFKIMRNEPYHK